MKKSDFILILAGIAAAIIISLLILPFSVSGERVLIYQNNELMAEIPLDKSDTVSLLHNTVSIDNGYVIMKSADCKNQICVKHKKISKKGESIVCLPNKVLVEIK